LTTTARRPGGLWPMTPCFPMTRSATASAPAPTHNGEVVTEPRRRAVVASGLPASGPASSAASRCHRPQFIAWRTRTSRLPRGGCARDHVAPTMSNAVEVGTGCRVGTTMRCNEPATGRGSFAALRGVVGAGFVPAARPARAGVAVISRVEVTIADAMTAGSPVRETNQVHPFVCGRAPRRQPVSPMNHCYPLQRIAWANG
jgi:hypothetical protein